MLDDFKALRMCCDFMKKLHVITIILIVAVFNESVYP